MSSIDLVIKKMDSLEQEFKTLRRRLEKAPEEWLSEKDAAKYTGLSVIRLQALRYAGKVGRWRKRNSGRGIQYLKSELDKLFTESK